MLQTSVQEICSIIGKLEEFLRAVLNANRKASTKNPHNFAAACRRSSLEGVQHVDQSRMTVGFLTDDRSEVVLAPLVTSQMFG